jgi:mannitol-1-phosphate 5-dehydrogenase
MTLSREAFLEESGAALIARHQGMDPLFTAEGFRAYAEDLLVRMTNPYLRDRVERVVRDPLRKLGWDDRLIGTMRLALDVGITPHRFALGAAAALETVEIGRSVTATLEELWSALDEPPGRKSQLIDLITEARSKLNPKEKQSWKLLMS